MVRLASREAVRADFDAFYDNCFFNERANVVLRQEVRHEWEVTLAHEAAITLVVEDEERPAGQQIVGCAQMVFVTDRFAAWVKSLPEPNLNVQATHAMPDGAWPLLSRTQVAEANGGGGLIGAFIRWGRANGLLTPEQAKTVGQVMSDVFLEFVRGYHFKELLIQAYTGAAHEQALHAGFLDRGRVPCAAMYLMGLTREEAQAREGFVMSHYFTCVHPRFGFTRRQQELLCLCLRLPDPSEARLADALGISEDAVQKLWEFVYQRIQRVNADLLSLADKHPLADKGRGREKRRRLLHYLRQHPEELRPYKPRRTG